MPNELELAPRDSLVDEILALHAESQAAYDRRRWKAINTLAMTTTIRWIGEISYEMRAEAADVKHSLYKDKGAEREVDFYEKYRDLHCSTSISEEDSEREKADRTAHLHAAQNTALYFEAEGLMTSVMDSGNTRGVSVGWDPGMLREAKRHAEAPSDSQQATRPPRKGWLAKIRSAFQANS